MAPPAALRPVEDRLAFPDVLRGVALLGILPVNVAIFAFPLVWLTEPAPLTGGWVETAAFLVTRVFFEQKFITLFSLLFGLGLGLQVARVQARGRAWAGFLLRRLGVLFVFGLLHAALLFWGDILATYAVVGVIGLVGLRLTPRDGLRLGLLCIALPFALLLLAAPFGFLLDAMMSGFDRAAFEARPGAFQPGMATGGLDAFLAGMATGDPAFEIELVTEGSYLRLAAVRLLLWAGMLVVTLTGYGWRIAGLFLIGMVAARDGRALRPHEHPAWFARLLGYGLLVGVPAQSALAGVGVIAGDSIGWLMVGEVLNYVGSLALAASYAGAVGLVVARAPSWLTAPLGAVGRTALSGYILQSVVFSALFTGWGLGLYGQLDRATVWGVVVGFWVVQVLLANGWLAVASRGPLEAAWRALTYGRARAG